LPRVEVRLLGALGDAVTDSRTDFRVVRALTLVEDCFADTTLGLGVVATRLGISPPRLANLVKAATGVTFHRHLERCRVAAAVTLLATTSLSVKEITVLVGYSSTSLLDIHFKALTGRTPTTFRREATQGGRGGL
jgi:transcriptional regulator GlxA family with amidase domain